MSDLEAARMVLAKALADPNSLVSLFRSCQTCHFPEHYQLLFESMRKSYLERGSVDVTILKDAGDKVKTSLLTLVTEQPMGDISYWIRRLTEAHSRQCLYLASAQMTKALKNAQSFSESKSRAIGIWDAALRHRLSSDMVRLADIKPEDAEKPYEPTGFLPWDALTGGMSPGTVHVLAGRPGRGKTTLATQMARIMALNKKPTLMVPLEMSLGQTLALARKQGEIEAPLYALDNAPRTWRELAIDLRWIVEAGQIKGIFIDHLGYLGLPRIPRQNRVEEIGEILRSVRQTMRTLNTSIMIVCQLNRAITGRRSEEPELSDLRESGEIEQEADSVSFLWCKKDERDKGKAQYTMTVAKNRFGPEKRIKLIFNKPARKFEYGDEEIP